jgi:hypothetical protein
MAIRLNANTSCAQCAELHRDDFTIPPSRSVLRESIFESSRQLRAGRFRAIEVAPPACVPNVAMLVCPRPSPIGL